MVTLADLPIELIEGIMDAAHPMPHGQIDSRHVEQTPAASTFGAMRLVCRELNLKVFKRYVECLFSVHTVMLLETSFQTLIDLAGNEHFRKALCTIFIDTRMLLRRQYSGDSSEWRVIDDYFEQQNFLGSDRESDMFSRILETFPNLREISVEHAGCPDGLQTRMICLGSSHIQKQLGSRALLGHDFEMDFLRNGISLVLSCIAAVKKQLFDFQIRLVNRKNGKAEGDYIIWDDLESVVHHANFNTDFLSAAMKSPKYEGLELALQGLRTLSLPIRGPTLDRNNEYEEYENGPISFEPKILAKFISMSPGLDDLTVYFATGEEQAPVDIAKAVPWTNLPELRALELGGARFNYDELITGLKHLKNTLRIVTLRHVRLNSTREWVSLIRFLHTELTLADFEIWEPADENGDLCFRNLQGKCYGIAKPYRAWRVQKILPENLDNYLDDLKRTKLHQLSDQCQW